MSAVLLASSALAAVLGCACLALGQERHWKSVTGTSSKALGGPRVGGWALVTVSLGLSVARDGGSFAALIWPLLLAVGAVLTGAALTWKPVTLRPLATLFRPAE